MHVKYTRLPIRSLLLGCSMLALPLQLSAAPDFLQGPHHPPGPPMEMPMGPPRDFDAVPPFLRDLKLSDAQQDKVFDIVHAAAPALRVQSKALNKAREALHDLGRSSQFNDESAMTLAQTQGKAETQLAFLRTKMEHDIFAVLTSQQQADLVTHQHEPRPGHGDAPLPPRP